MGEDTFKSMSGLELRVTRFGIGGKAAQGTTSGALQAALAGYSTGAFGLDSDAHMASLHALVVEIRAALVANGIMKGSA